MKNHNTSSSIQAHSAFDILHLSNNSATIANWMPTPRLTRSLVCMRRVRFSGTARARGATCSHYHNMQNNLSFECAFVIKSSPLSSSHYVWTRSVAIHSHRLAMAMVLKLARLALMVGSCKRRECGFGFVSADYTAQAISRPIFSKKMMCIRIT